uniref:Uncharacterized protein n=1 Tax=viral metagenome TaxID=1070528 RepID=A0A6C0I946_9ZZZZ
MSQSKYNLVLCEMFNRNIHGSPKKKITEIDGHYLLISKFEGDASNLHDDSDSDSDNSNDSDDSNINNVAEYYNEYYNEPEQEIKPHIIIRNYQNIIARPDYIKPEIGECIVLESQHTVVIIKTMWIKIIQRKWKKIYAERQTIIRRWSQIAALYNRELTGRWPDSCIRYPTLRGMLVLQ